MSSDQYGTGPDPRGPEFVPPSTPSGPYSDPAPGRPGPARPPGAYGQPSGQGQSGQYGQFGQDGQDEQDEQYGQSGEYGRPSTHHGSGSGRDPRRSFQDDPDRPRLEPPRPPKRRGPAIITAAVIVVVALVVVIGTVVANQRDREAVRTPPSSPPAQPTSVPSTSADSITFSSREGSGRLTIVSHQWTSDGAIPPANEYLRLKLKITATEGTVSYGPEYFQSFDEDGDLFQTTEAGAEEPLLASGVLRPGDSVTGGISFDIPRGPVTLLMSNALLESVTALRIAE